MVVVEEPEAVEALVKFAWHVSRSDVKVASPSSSAIFVSFFNCGTLIGPFVPFGFEGLFDDCNSLMVVLVL